MDHERLLMKIINLSHSNALVVYFASKLQILIGIFAEFMIVGLCQLREALLYSNTTMTSYHLLPEIITLMTDNEDVKILVKKLLRDFSYLLKI